MSRKHHAQLCRTLLVCCGFGLTLSTLSENTLAANQISAEAISSLRQQIEAWVDEGSIVGAEVLVLQKGQPVWHEAFGLRDLDTKSPMTRDGFFRIRSMTKPIIGTVALRLIERGDLSLDATIGDFFPELKDVRPEVSVRQLLTHTAGYEFNPFPRKRGSYSSLRESVVDAAHAGPTRDQGEFQYSDLGSATLGAILEVAGGETLERLVQKEVFDVFGMDESFTRYAPDSDWASRMNSTHWLASDGGSFERYWSPDEEQDMPYFRASGGVYSTAKDYAKFMEAWRTGITESGDRILSEELMQLALTQLPNAPYGMHWEVSNVPGSDKYVFGHGGSDGTFAVAVPDQEMTVLYFTQSRGRDCRNQFVMLAGLTGEFGALDELNTWGWWRDKEASTPVPVKDGVDLSRFEGAYRADGEIVFVSRGAAGLKLTRGTDAVRQEAPNSLQTRLGRIVCQPMLAAPVSSVDLAPVDANRFKMVRKTGGEIVEIYWPDTTVDFKIEDGRVTGYSIEYDPDVVEIGRALQ